MVDFKKELSNFIFTDKYARYNEQKKRRETFDESIDRVLNMHLEKLEPLNLDKTFLDEIKWSFDLVKEKRIVPSMRSLQFGGKAILAHNARLFNCSVCHVDSIRNFSEIFYLLLCGCGVGIGLSEYFLRRLPDLVSSDNKTGIVLQYTIEDSIEGWADSLEALLNTYFKNTAYSGRKIIFDYSKIRPEGTPLKTGGGKAPGYKGLKNTHKKIKELLDYIIETLNQKRLKTINAYDIIMHSADAVLSGGVRRSACSVIFDKDDIDMINAKIHFPIDKMYGFVLDDSSDKYCGNIKIGKKIYSVELSKDDYNNIKKNRKINWLKIEPQRARSNNSVLLIRDNITKKEFEDIIEKTKEFGEPGFVFANDKFQLFNPCFEVGFKPVTKDGVCGVQFCNLTSINGAKIKTQKDFKDSVKAATIIGTVQATYTNFPYLSNVSQYLTEKEALIGVSITGIMDNPEILLNSEQQILRSREVVKTNKKWSKILGINPAERCTVIKPEGTSSLLLGSASGIHPHHAKKYFRRVQINRRDNTYKFFKKFNKHAIEKSIWDANNTDDVITFPVIVENNCLTKKDFTAIEHLKIIRDTQEDWVLNGMQNSKSHITNNVSCTVIVKIDEWKNVVNFLYEHREYFAAVSLLSDSGEKDYEQAPLCSITTEEDEKEFNKLIEKWKEIDYTQMKEDEDTTNLQQEVSCAGGKCELI